MIFGWCEVFKEVEEGSEAASPMKPSRKPIPRENTDGYSITWSDEPSNAQIRPSRRPGPPSPARPEKGQFLLMILIFDE